MDKLLDACDDRTKAIFIASPGNPTGWVATREEQQAVLDFARKRGIAIISDEVYGTLVFGEREHAPSFLEISTEEDDVFVIGGFSKAWAMTGWRMGWVGASGQARPPDGCDVHCQQHRALRPSPSSARWPR